jgi:hypothetical protein
VTITWDETPDLCGERYSLTQNGGTIDGEGREFGEGCRRYGSSLTMKAK